MLSTRRQSRQVTTLRIHSQPKTKLAHFDIHQISVVSELGHGTVRQRAGKKCVFFYLIQIAQRLIFLKKLHWLIKMHLVVAQERNVVLLKSVRYVGKNKR